MDIKEDWRVWCISFLIKKWIRGDSGKKSDVNVNEVLTQELHKSVIKIFKRRKVYARFKNNFLAANLAEMGSLSKRIEVLNIYCVS